MSQIPVADAAEMSYPVGPALVDAPVSGPYKYASASPSAIEMVRNENWVSPWTGEPAYLDRIVYSFFDGSKDAMIAAFLAGELDLATDLQQGDYTAIAGVDPSIGEVRIEPPGSMSTSTPTRPAWARQGSPGACRSQRPHGPQPGHRQGRAV